ncbi:hypothetical protein [Caudoviricetes sp.]|nr:hypothetical protein [Caudoviricetes sp.]
MKLLLIRETFTNESTIGSLYINDKFECFSLEDVVRKEKIKGKTAIPDGVYELIITMSPKFKRELPRLLNVPNYEGVLIHAGNSAKDTDGCILVGTSRKENWISNSQTALLSLLNKLEKAYEKKDPIYIEIKTSERQDTTN